MVPKVWTMLEDIKLETCSSIASFSGGNSSSSSTVLLCLITFIHSTVESFSGHVCLLCPIEWQMLHLRRYSSGTMVLGPSLTIGGLEHLLLLCPGCPHLLHDCMVILSEDEAVDPPSGDLIVSSTLDLKQPVLLCQMHYPWRRMANRHNRNRVCISKCFCLVVVRTQRCEIQVSLPDRKSVV